jgi:hypothetical protein
MNLIDLYVDPVEFFRREIGSGKQSLRGPALAVLAASLLSFANLLVMQHSLFNLVNQSIINNGYLSHGIKDSVLGEFQGLVPLILVSGGFGCFYFFILWPLIPAMLANAAVLWNRDYQYREMLRCTGLCFLAFLPVQVVATLVALLPLHVPYNPLLSSRNVEDVGNDIADLVKVLRNGSPFLPVRNLNLLGTVWFGIVLLIGFRQLYCMKWIASLCVVGGLGFVYFGGNYMVGLMVGK